LVLNPDRGINGRKSKIEEYSHEENLSAEQKKEIEDPRLSCEDVHKGRKGRNKQKKGEGQEASCLNDKQGEVRE
jgi:hypothetical protein